MATIEKTTVSDNHVHLQVRRHDGSLYTVDIMAQDEAVLVHFNHIQAEIRAEKIASNQIKIYPNLTNG